MTNDESRWLSRSCRFACASNGRSMSRPCLRQRLDCEEGVSGQPVAAAELAVESHCRPLSRIVERGEDEPHACGQRLRQPVEAIGLLQLIERVEEDDAGPLIEASSAFIWAGTCWRPGRTRSATSTRPCSARSSISEMSSARRSDELAAAPTKRSTTGAAADRLRSPRSPAPSAPTSRARPAVEDQRMLGPLPATKRAMAARLPSRPTKTLSFSALKVACSLALASEREVRPAFDRLDLGDVPIDGRLQLVSTAEANVDMIGSIECARRVACRGGCGDMAGASVRRTHVLARAATACAGSRVAAPEGVAGRPSTSEKAMASAPRAICEHRLGASGRISRFRSATGRTCRASLRRSGHRAPVHRRRPGAARHLASTASRRLDPSDAEVVLARQQA